ncbi:MAG: DUF983 domain-containing protein [Proteobacteria bacterium]|nr:DUF983 domain-containing protein [Pseudomonadota bacterium]
MPPLGTTLARGLACRCPSCGKAPVFDGYLTVVPACANCGAPLGAARADDAPPYFTILIVGHIVVALMLVVQRAYDPSNLVLSAIFVPLTIVLSLLLLRPIKGATVGLMLHFNMVKPEDELPPPAPAAPVAAATVVRAGGGLPPR